jgi:hypothetical protein
MIARSRSFADSPLWSRVSSHSDGRTSTSTPACSDIGRLMGLAEADLTPFSATSCRAAPARIRPGSSHSRPPEAAAVARARGRVALRVLDAERDAALAPERRSSDYGRERRRGARARRFPCSPPRLRLGAYRRPRPRPRPGLAAAWTRGAIDHAGRVCASLRPRAARRRHSDTDRLERARRGRDARRV